MSAAARGESVRIWALIRLAALPAIYLGERLVAHPSPRSDPFGPLLAAATVYALVTALLAWRERGRQPPVQLLALLDLAFLWALTYTSGGPFSQLRYAFFLLPIGAALLLRPALTAAASLVVVLSYLAIALLYPTEGAGDFELTQAVYLVWMGIVAVLLSQLLARRADEVARLSADRGRLVAQALDAEDRERRRLAGALHDEAVQNLLAARHELAGGTVDLAFVQHGLDRTIEQLRDAVFDLYPAALDHAGLAAALEAVAEHAGRRAGFDWQVEVDADAAGGPYDPLLFSLARELIINVAKHAEASRLTVRVRATPAELQLEVADDGRGLDPARLRSAPLDGHIGLASATERVEALDGSLEIAAEAGQGTLVRARIPVRPAAAAER